MLASILNFKYRKNMRNLPLIVISFALAVSCDKKEAEARSIMETEIAMPTKIDSSAVNNTDEYTASAASTGGERPALNPEHGQPYHRCEIPVGAPMDSAPPADNGSKMMTPVSAGPGFNTNPIAPAQEATGGQILGAKPANNPPHGEPHHRCDIQVGAPLI